MRFIFLLVGFFTYLTVPIQVFAGRNFIYDTSASSFVIDPLRYTYSGGVFLACQKSIYKIRKELKTICNGRYGYVYGNSKCFIDERVIDPDFLDEIFDNSKAIVNNFVNVKATGRYQCYYNGYTIDENLRLEMREDNENFQNIVATIRNPESSKQYSEIDKGWLRLIFEYTEDETLKEKIRTFFKEENKNQTVQSKGFQNNGVR